MRALIVSVDPHARPRSPFPVDECERQIQLRVTGKEPEAAASVTRGNDSISMTTQLSAAVDRDICRSSLAPASLLPLLQSRRSQ
jgi:hypothetical protein